MLAFTDLRKTFEITLNKLVIHIIINARVVAIAVGNRLPDQHLPFQGTISMSTSRFMKRSTLTTGAISLISLSSLFGASPSYAAIVNGGFETGNFRGWQTIGDRRIVGSEFGSGPIEGNFQALLTTGSGSVSVEELEDFLVLPRGTANLLTGEEIVEASASPFA